MSHKRCHADSRSCLRCLKQGHNCDGNRPCLNCLTLGLADECADLNVHHGASQGVASNARSQTKHSTSSPANDFEIKPFNPDGDFVTISVSNIYTPLTLNMDTKDDDQKIKGKRGPKKSETSKSAPKRGTKRSRALKDLDDEDFTCSYDESSHSTSSGSERVGRTNLKKRAKSNTSDPFEFTDLPYQSMDGTESMTATPIRRDSCSEDTLGEILASTCGTPIDESSAWSQLDSTGNFANPMEEETFPTIVSSTAPSEGAQTAMGDQFYFGEMQTTVSFIDDAFDSNIFSY